MTERSRQSLGVQCPEPLASPARWDPGSDQRIPSSSVHYCNAGQLLAMNVHTDQFPPLCHLSRGVLTAHLARRLGPRRGTAGGGMNQRCRLCRFVECLVGWWVPDSALAPIANTSSGIRAVPPLPSLAASARSKNANSSATMPSRKNNPYIEIVNECSALQPLCFPSLCSPLAGALHPHSRPSERRYCSRDEIQ